MFSLVAVPRWPTLLLDSALPVHRWRRRTPMHRQFVSSSIGKRMCCVSLASCVVGSTRLRRRCRLTVKVASPAEIGASDPDATFRVLKADSHVVVVGKGEGLLTSPGIGAEKADCLISRLQAAGYSDVSHAPHRLDRDTSGVVVLGRTKEARKALSLQFQERTISKQYVALVWGWPAEASGEVAAPIGKVRLSPDEPARMAVCVGDPAADGFEQVRPCVTRWRVMELYDTDSPVGRLAGGVQCARLALEPVTGRNRQLRLHMAHLGHPILGDTMFLGTREASNHVVADAARSWHRLCLHACVLEFSHPSSGERVRVRSPTPF